MLESDSDAVVYWFGGVLGPSGERVESRETWIVHYRACARTGHPLGG